MHTVDADPLDALIDTKNQTTAWNGRDFPDVKYPLPLRENEMELLFHVHTRDRRQTALRGMVTAATRRNPTIYSENVPQRGALMGHHREVLLPNALALELHIIVRAQEVSV